MKSKYSTKYFPFSPGIPWKIKNNKYVVPEITTDTWKDTLKDRDIVILSHGGLLESFFSLYFVAAINKIESNNI